MKRSTEANVSAALRLMDFDDLFVYKPQDGLGTNRKPCDFMVWWADGVGPQSAWIEVKDTSTVDAFPASELRPAQRLGIRTANELGLPYWLVVHWRRWYGWTISRAYPVLVTLLAKNATSISRSELMGLGIESTPGQLAQNLRAALLGDLD